MSSEVDALNSIITILSSDAIRTDTWHEIGRAVMTAKLALGSRISAQAEGSDALYYRKGQICPYCHKGFAFDFQARKVTCACKPEASHA